MEHGKSEVNMEDIAEIPNKITDVLIGTAYIVVGYDNTGRFLQVIIDKKAF